MSGFEPSRGETLSGARIFGTDGIRGRAGEGWLCVEQVAALGRAMGTVLGHDHGKRVRKDKRLALLAHDGRRSGPELEGALAHGLRASGFEVHSAGLLTTPGLALLARKGDYALGAMISASHNPAEDNGIKVFSGDGEKLSDQLELDVEQALRADDCQDTPTILAGKHDPAHEAQYLDYLMKHAAAGLSLAGDVIALDCANGGGSRVAPRVFGRLGAQLYPMASEPDGDNINRDCGSTHPEALQREVRTRKAKIGIALDGDGDRCILVDELGNLVNGDGILTVLARHAAQQRRGKETRIVATVMSNRGLHRALREVGVEVLEVGVGDRAVVEAMRLEKISLGGEQSGHIISADTFIGDGISTALSVLQVMQASGAPLSELTSSYQPMPQVLLNVKVSEKPALTELPEVLALVREVEERLGVDGRVLLRYSGTEPLARVMVEGLDADGIRAEAQAIVQALEARIGSGA